MQRWTFWTLFATALIAVVLLVGPGGSGCFYYSQHATDC